MTNSFIIKRAGNLKGLLYKIFALISQRMRAFATRNQAIFEGIARTAAPFGGNVLNDRS